MGKESSVKQISYMVIQGWMVTDLHLKGNELLVYAIIYGFTQTEVKAFNGRLQYLADWTNSTKQGVIKCLKSLVEKGYIIKEDKCINGVKFCEYYTTKFNEVLNKVEWGIKQSLPNNIEDNIEDNIYTKKTLSYERVKESKTSSLSFERESESENEVCKGKSKKFVKPTLEEVQAYCAERGNGIDPEGFIAFYESKGWKIGNQPMKNWKAAVVTWEKKRKNESAPPGNNKKYDDRGLDVLAKLYKKYDKEEKENES